MFENLILGGYPVKKSATDPAKGATFTIVDGVLVRGQLDMDLTAPQPTIEDAMDATPADARFPSESSVVDRPVRQGVDDSVRPQGVYALVEGAEVDLTSGGTLPADTFLGVRTTAPIGEPAMYKPSAPGRMPTDPGAPGPDDMDDNSVSPFRLLDDEDADDKPTVKAIRLGKGYVARKSI